MPETIEKSLLDLDFASLTRRTFTPSPVPPESLTVQRQGGLLAVRMTLPPAGFAIYQAAPGLHRFGPSPPPDLKAWQPPR
jgi:hypothetical protein